MGNNIRLSKEKRDPMIAEIKKYFSEEREEDLGDLSASLILDFFIKELSTEFYNQGVYDAYAYMSEKLEDLLEIQK